MKLMDKRFLFEQKIMKPSKNRNFKVNQKLYQKYNKVSTIFFLYNQFIDMNQIYIGLKEKFNNQIATFFISFEEADKYLQILRNDFFNKITISLPNDINDKQLRFMMHLSRILKHNGQIYLENSWENEQSIKFRNLGKKLGFFQGQNNQKLHYFSKTKPQQTKIQATKQNSKMTIGFKANQVQEIDEQELMKNQNINIQKQKIQSCNDKPRACANCNCGKKNNEQPLVSKQKLVQGVNQGKPVSGCGKCFLGDSFRCGSCPYKGLPAFKPGDKLKLMDQGQVIVQTGDVKVQSGKVKIQL